MDLPTLAQCGYSLRMLFEGFSEIEAAAALERLVSQEQWELLAMIAITANEVSARRTVLKLLEHDRLAELVLPACLRRQVRRQEVIMSNPARARRAFRDIDAEDNESGVPEHILQEAQDIAESAEASRLTALSREAGVDRDALREFIVTELAKRLNTDPQAGEALVVIARASAFEDARRTAALKLANHDLTMQRLAREGRGADMIAVADNSGLESVRTNMARALGPVLGAMRAQQDWASLRWAGKHHPDPKAREAVAEVLRAESQQP
jgi:hypothetical protein